MKKLKKLLITIVICTAIFMIYNIVNFDFAGNFSFSMPSWENLINNLFYSGPRAEDGKDPDVWDILSAKLKDKALSTKKAAENLLDFNKPSAYVAVRLAAMAQNENSSEAEIERELLLAAKSKEALQNMMIDAGRHQAGMVEGGMNEGMAEGTSENDVGSFGVYGYQEIGDALTLDLETLSDEVELDRPIIMVVDPSHTEGGAMRNKSFGRIICTNGLVVYFTSPATKEAWDRVKRMLGYEITGFVEEQSFPDYNECYARDFSAQCDISGVEEGKQALARTILGLEPGELSEELTEHQASRLTQVLGVRIDAGHRYRFPL